MKKKDRAEQKKKRTHTSSIFRNDRIYVRTLHLILYQTQNECVCLWNFFLLICGMRQGAGILTGTLLCQALVSRGAGEAWVDLI